MARETRPPHDGLRKVPMQHELPPLQPEDPITQYGHMREGGFRRFPRQGVEGAISVIRGRLTVDDATRLVRRRTGRPGDAVRYTTVGALASAGFSIRRDPVPLNPEHCLVEYPDKWQEEATVAFDRCFEEPVVEDEDG